MSKIVGNKILKKRTGQAGGIKHIAGKSFSPEKSGDRKTYQDLMNISQQNKIDGGFGNMGGSRLGTADYLADSLEPN